MMSDIKDNYTFKELEHLYKEIDDLQSFLREAEVLGYNTKQTTEFFNKMKKKEFSTLRNISDIFNKHYSERGWIAYESLNVPIMEKSIDLAEQGKIDEGEQVLIDYFSNRDNVDSLLAKLSNIEEFMPRRTLLLHAAEDHFEGRYHASVPIMLMMIDGFVNDIEQKGFFAEGVNLTAWDSIAAHSSGLQKMTSILGESRKKTREEKITLPYRNGILHGRDLGYANAHVSSKALATLLALKDWAKAVRNSKKNERKEFIPPTSEENAQAITALDAQLRESQKFDAYKSQWKPRNIEVGTDIPEKGKIDEFKEETPERMVVSFLHLLFKKNYGDIARLASHTWKRNNTIGVMAREIREIFERKKLIDYKLMSVQETSSVYTNIRVWMQFEKEDGTHFEHEADLGLNYENEEGKICACGFEKGEWKLLQHGVSEIEWSDIRR
ncbi:hypothetical protein [Priestia megaterium]|uniref:hypothetical protein n=1 Tax=Priestia megaterium TaxID=1404 RepID=UPI002877737E|nr:hypothetical protein [Priestia megaterium]